LLPLLLLYRAAGSRSTIGFPKCATSNGEFCYALTDPRRNTIGQGWAVRARAAQIVARERSLDCDYDRFARIHAIEQPARDTAMRQNLDLIEAGTRMMQGPPTTVTNCSLYGNTATCISR
jgi:hypothetical protein